MPSLARSLALMVVFVGLALIAAGVSLAALSVQGTGSSGVACVVVVFIPLCFSWGSNAAVVGVAASVISVVLLLIVFILVKKFLEGIAPSE